MVRPFRTYRELALDRPPPTAWVLIHRPLWWLLFIASFVSLTAAGRLVLPHIVSAMIAWAFVPLFQIAWVGIVARRFAPRHALPSAVDLFYVGQGPWLLFLFFLAAVCLFVPDVWGAFQWLLGSGVLFIAGAVTALWSIVLTHAFFRSGLGVSRPRAFAATGAYYTAFASTIVLYYLATGQLLPLVFGAA